MISRTKFIQSSLLSACSLFVPSFVFSNVVKAIEGMETDESLPALLKKAADFRKKEKFSKAIAVYEQLIKLYPQEIRVYNGYRKTILSQKSNLNKSVDVVNMLQIAASANPDNKDIKQALNKEYLKASLGNKVVLRKINFDVALLPQVGKEYKKYSDIKNPTQNGNRSRVIRLLEAKADNINPRNNKEIISFNSNEKQKHKHRFEKVGAPALEKKLNALLIKSPDVNRSLPIREHYKLICSKHIKDKNHAKALDKSLEYISNVDSQDCFFLGQVRRLSKYKKRYDLLLNVEVNNHDKKQTFWSAISLFDAQMLALNNNMGKKSNHTFENLLTFLDAKASNFGEQLESNIRRVKLNLNNNQLVLARQNILKLCDKLGSVTNSHMIDKVNILAAQYYQQSRQANNAKKIVAIAKMPYEYVNDPEEMTRSLAALNSGRLDEKPIHLQNLIKRINNI
ncbi:hypothetical protein [Parasediminibacterium sp. JCM 36343]|uniref:hypothetical protein n=1 Tax=Parasediminibacterium sp. JCM 36343 TaxID=3374279 RepID=UPI003979E45B